MEIQPNGIDIINKAPVLMLASERLMLYSLIFGLRPRRCLEIGTNQGGSAMIITAALDDLGMGQLACVDPNPVVLPENWDLIRHRATLFQGMSPEILPDAARMLGNAIDFALIDGDHSVEGVTRDLEGVLPLMAPMGYLLCHDAHYRPVADGIAGVLRAHPDNLVDCGLITIETTRDDSGVSWGGLRLLKYSRTR